MSTNKSRMNPTLRRFAHKGDLLLDSVISELVSIFSNMDSHAEQLLKKT